MQKLELTADTLDNSRVFKLEKLPHSFVSLHKDYEKQGDGIYWGMQHGGCVKDVYTEQDNADRERFNALAPLSHGDIVEIDGQQYKLRYLGDHSDCCVFDRV